MSQSGTSSAPIVVDDSDSSIDSDLEGDTTSSTVVAVAGSPLKIICSERYRNVITICDSPDVQIEVKREHVDSDAEDDFQQVCDPKVKEDLTHVRKKLKFSDPMEEYPVYEIPPPKYSAERVLRILLDPAISPSKVCCKRPVSISSSATYVIDISKLADPEDVKNDNFGSWNHSGSHPSTYRVNVEDDGYIRVEKCASGATGADVVYLRRLHSVHPSNSQFKRLIAFVSDADNNPHQLALVTYHIPVGFVPVIKSHGNSKVSTPFHPTWCSTKKHIKQTCGTEGPKSVVASLSAEVGGVMEATAPGQLPRDEKQIINYKARVSLEQRQSYLPGASRDAAADDLFMIMHRCYTEDPSKKYVRAVNEAPEPAIVVTTDRQLQDIARFCTTAFEFSPLTVDPTFNLGDFDVTIITYRHLLLQSKRYKNPPVFIGPCCIHYRKTFSTYLFFASTVVGQCRQLEGVRAIGTDGEQALSDAFKHEFGFAQHMTCFLHVQRNVKDMIHKCNIPTHVSADIIDDIFGKKFGSTYVEGLVDASDSIDFQEKLEKILEKWRNLSLPSSANLERFISWFQNHKVPVIQDSMLRSVREECGLGSPPSQFTTNACETANSMLKSQTNYKRSEMFEFLEKLKQLIYEQDREIERAIIGRGKYELRPQYMSLYVPEVKWFVMSIPQREQHIRKFSNASVSDISPSDLSEGIQKTLLASECLGRDLSPASILSVSVHDVADAVRIPLNCLEGIWNKATELLKTEEAIVSAPGVGDGAKFVLSYSGRKPHLVVPKRGGAFACDEECPNWKALSICAHSVAVASLCGKLSEFVTWFKKVKRAPSLTKYAQATATKGKGRKGSQGPRKRKTSVAIENTLANPTMISTSPIANESPTLEVPVEQTRNPLAFQSAPVTQISNIQSPSVAQTNIHIPQHALHPHYQSPWGFYGPPPPPPPPHPTLPLPPPPPPYMPYVAATPSGTPSLHPSSPFTLCKISGNIRLSVCAGCRNKYPKNPNPPDDLCIKHQEWREYTPSGSQTPQSRYGNAYYHFNPTCVWMRFPEFVPMYLEVSPEIYQQLDTSHKQRLQRDFQVYLA